MSTQEDTSYVDANAVEDLVDSYESLSKYDRKQANEAKVRQQYINPLLRALGWDTTTDQVKPEQRTIVGDADYALSLNGREQLYIEAKKFIENLDGERRVGGEAQSYAEQAIEYAWHQGCDWAILTNFEEIRLYFTHVPKDSLEDGLVFSISVDDYTTEEGLEKLTSISKRAVKNDSLERLERQRGRQSVTEEILNDLSEARVTLTKDVHDSHPELDMGELREGVQRILDRLVVMRVAEDRSVINPDTLLNMSESWRKTTIDPDSRMLVGDLKNAFRDFDSVYNSELFSEHHCEDYEISNDVLEGVIKSLYEYNFAYLDADILGAIYEDYLGHAVEDREEDLELVAEVGERREDGIYYTPVSVVEYIVDSTLGEQIDKIMSEVRTQLLDGESDFEQAREEFDKIQDITVLDVTCGSGSFLIKAYDVIADAYEEYRELVKEANESTQGMDIQAYSKSQTIPTDYRQEILRNNIYGVDKDYQATEIASVNLLLKSLNKEEKLPTILDNNIQSGNSLVNGSPGQVSDLLDIPKSQAAEMCMDWESQFSEIFDRQGGFDFIIGNPPWGADLGEIENWIESDEKYNLSGGQCDSYELFLELGEQLLRRDGTLSFIIPDSILNKNEDAARRWLVENKKLDSVYKLGEGIFDNVFTGTSIVEYQNQEPENDHFVDVGLIQKEDRQRMLGSGGRALESILQERSNSTLQSRFSSSDGWTIPVWAGEEDHKIMDQMESGTISWDNVVDNGRGDEIGRDGDIMQCPYCMEWDTYPKNKAESKGGGYYPKTCSHCGEEYEFGDAVATKQIIKDSQTGNCDTPVFFGEDINRYRTEEPSYIDSSHSGVGLKDDSRFRPPKLLIRQASVGFFATVDYTDSRCLQSVFSFIPKESRDDPYKEYDIEYFLGILNSRVMLYYYAKTEGITEWQSYPRHTQTDIMTLPVPSVDFDDPEERLKYEKFVSLVEEAIGNNEEQVVEELDWEIEEMVLELFGIEDSQRPRIWSELKQMQRLKIIREMFPDSGEE